MTDIPNSITDKPKIPLVEPWAQTINCKICGSQIFVTPDKVLYVDVPRKGIFKPDWQFLINCASCGSRNILTNIPSAVAVWVQLYGNK